MRYRPRLDGLRGIAIALVVAEHTRLLPGGNLGVVVFFVLSGYLITTLLVTEHDQAGAIRLGRFYARRAGRLLPALLLALSVIAVATLLATSIAPARVLTWVLLSLLYAVNLAVTLMGWRMFAPVDFVWTLSLEEQFYLLWPTALRRALRRHSPARVATWLLMFAWAIALLRAGWMVDGGDRWVAYYAPWFRSDALFVGCAMALLPPLHLRPLLPVAVGALAISAIYGSPFQHREFTLVIAMPLVTFATAVLVSAEPRWLSWRPLRYLGRISYGLYLWNGVVSAVWLEQTSKLPEGPLQAPLAIAASLCLAIASTHLLEEPVRRWGRSRTAALAGDRGAEAVVAGAGF